MKEFQINRVFSSAYAKSVSDFTRKFALNQGMWGRVEKPLLLSVSGGADSILMLWMIADWGCQIRNEKQSNSSCSVVYFDHQTRPNQIQQEIDLIRSVCQHLGFPLSIHRVPSGMTLHRPSEDRWRQFRRDFILKWTKENRGTCVTGHHLDDSFEWHLMQSFKQSSLSTSVGIPYGSRVYWRPLMCLSRVQIKRVLRTEGLEWCEDRTNQTFDFERNRVRHQIVAKVKENYPQALKNYAKRANELAEVLKLNSTQPKDRSDTFYINLKSPRSRLELEEVFKFHSLKKRGKWRRAIESLYSNQQTESFRGPIHLTGEIEVFQFSAKVFIFSKKTQYSQLKKQFNQHFVVRDSSFRKSRGRKKTDGLRRVSSKLFIEHLARIEPRCLNSEIFLIP